MNELTTAGRLGRVRATAYSKLTLALRVGALRDDGFHEVEALAVSISDPHDVIVVEAVPHPGGVTFEMRGETDDVPKDMTNLAARAADELLVRAANSVTVLRPSQNSCPPGGFSGGEPPAQPSFPQGGRLVVLVIWKLGAAPCT